MRTIRLPLPVFLNFKPSRLLSASDAQHCVQISFITDRDRILQLLRQIPILGSQTDGNIFWRRLVFTLIEDFS